MTESKVNYSAKYRKKYDPKRGMIINYCTGLPGGLAMIMQVLSENSFNAVGLTGDEIGMQYRDCPVNDWEPFEGSITLISTID